MTTIRTLTIPEFFATSNAQQLCQLYADESRNAALPEHEPQQAMYEAMEQLGILHMWGAYDVDELVGFIVLLVNNAPHYAHKMATLESFFVHADHRKGGTGIRLLRAAQSKAKELGAVGLFVSAPAGSRLEKAMPALGYKHSNTMFFRALT